MRGWRRRSVGALGCAGLEKWPWQDSNLQSLVPKTNALSIKPQGHCNIIQAPQPGIVCASAPHLQYVTKHVQPQQEALDDVFHTLRAQGAPESRIKLSSWRASEQIRNGRLVSFPPVMRATWAQFPAAELCVRVLRRVVVRAGGFPPPRLRHRWRD